MFNFKMFKYKLAHLLGQRACPLGKPSHPFRQQRRLNKLFFTFLLCPTIWLSGCASSSSPDASQANYSVASQEAMPAGSVREAEAHVSYSMSGVTTEQAQYAVEQESSSTSGEYIDRKIIREQYIEQEVQNVAEIIHKLEASITSLPGAYVESLREWKSKRSTHTYQHAELVMRIPEQEFPAFISQVEEQGHIIERNVTGQDVTEEFIDNEARLRNLLAHEERILKLYEKANTIEDMLKIEQELARIRSSIEQLEGRQKFLKQVTSTVKLTLLLYEVEEIDYLAGQETNTLFGEASLGFQKSVQDLFRLVQVIFIATITFLPYLLGFSVLLLPFIYILRKLQKRSQSATENGEKFKEKNKGEE